MPNLGIKRLYSSPRIVWTKIASSSDVMETISFQITLQFWTCEVQGSRCRRFDFSKYTILFFWRIKYSYKCPPPKPLFPYRSHVCLFENKWQCFVTTLLMFFNREYTTFDCDAAKICFGFWGRGEGILCSLGVLNPAGIRRPKNFSTKTGTGLEV